MPLPRRPKDFRHRGQVRGVECHRNNGGGPLDFPDELLRPLLEIETYHPGALRHQGCDQGRTKMTGATNHPNRRVAWERFLLLAQLMASLNPGHGQGLEKNQFYSNKYNWPESLAYRP